MDRPDVAILDCRVREIYREIDEVIQYMNYCEQSFEAAFRALVRIANHFDGVNSVSPQQMAQDALNAQKARK